MTTDHPLLDPRDPNSWRPAEPFPEAIVRRLGELDGKVRVLEDWRLEMRTAFRLLQLTFGTSIVAAAAAVFSLLRA